MEQKKQNYENPQLTMYISESADVITMSIDDPNNIGGEDYDGW